MANVVRGLIIGFRVMVSIGMKAFIPDSWGWRILMKSVYLSDTVDVDRANVQVTEGHLDLQTHTRSLY